MTDVEHLSRGDATTKVINAISRATSMPKKRSRSKLRNSSNWKPVF
jgi:hypothetical protein